MRLIDADKCKRQLQKIIESDAPFGEDIIAETIKAAIDIINAQPTVKTEIVRCEECDARDGNRCRLLIERDPDTDHRIWSGFFCAYGERRKDGKIH